MKRRSFLQAVLGSTAVVILPDSAFAEHPIIESSSPHPAPSPAEIISTPTPPVNAPYWYLIGVEYPDGHRETFRARGNPPETGIDPSTRAPIRHARPIIDSMTMYQASIVVNLTIGQVLKSRAGISALGLVGWESVPEVTRPRYKRTVPVTKQYYVSGYSPLEP